MTNPNSSESPKPDTAPAPPKENPVQTQEDRVTLQTTGGVDEFRSADDSFPTITAAGTEMSATEAKAAKAAASAMWMPLQTVGGRNN